MNIFGGLFDNFERFIECILRIAGRIFELPKSNAIFICFQIKMGLKLSLPYLESGHFKVKAVQKKKMRTKEQLCKLI